MITVRPTIEDVLLYLEKNSLMNHKVLINYIKDRDAEITEANNIIKDEVYDRYRKTHATNRSV